MELALSLGDTPNKPFCKSKKILRTDLGFCMAVGKVCGANGEHNSTSKETGFSVDEIRTASSDRPPVQLDLLPFSPVPRTQLPPSSNKFPPFPWLDQNLVSEPGVNRAAAISSPNSTVSSFQMDFSTFRRAIKEKGDFEIMMAENMNGVHEGDRSRASSSRGSDEEENGNISRKKLRLSKEQSAFLEVSFKEHNTLNPKQKQALAKQLNLRPRQVEVWFQNRRARTKLKQTEVDCEYLKRWCETLTQENRRLQKEVQELRAHKASKPFHSRHPATTLTMCPSCERVVTATTTTASDDPPAATTNKPIKLFSLTTDNSHSQH